MISLAGPKNIDDLRLVSFIKLLIHKNEGGTPYKFYSPIPKIVIQKSKR